MRNNPQPIRAPPRSKPPHRAGWQRCPSHRMYLLPGESHAHSTVLVWSQGKGPWGQPSARSGTAGELISPFLSLIRPVSHAKSGLGCSERPVLRIEGAFSHIEWQEKGHFLSNSIAIIAVRFL